MLRTKRKIESQGCTSSKRTKNNDWNKSQSFKPLKLQIFSILLQDINKTQTELWDQISAKLGDKLNIYLQESSINRDSFFEIFTAWIKSLKRVVNFLAKNAEPQKWRDYLVFEQLLIGGIKEEIITMLEAYMTKEVLQKPINEAFDRIVKLKLGNAIPELKNKIRIAERSEIMQLWLHLSNLLNDDKKSSDDFFSILRSNLMPFLKRHYQSLTDFRYRLFAINSINTPPKPTPSEQLPVSMQLN